MDKVVRLFFFVHRIKNHRRRPSGDYECEKIVDIVEKNEFPVSFLGFDPQIITFIEYGGGNELVKSKLR